MIKKKTKFIFSNKLALKDKETDRRPSVCRPYRVFLAFPEDDPKAEVLSALYTMYGTVYDNNFLGGKIIRHEKKIKALQHFYSIQFKGLCRHKCFKTMLPNLLCSLPASLKTLNPFVSSEVLLHCSYSSLSF